MIRRLVLSVGAAALLAGVLAFPALGAPITCPSGQDPVKVAGGWECQNRPGSGDPSTEDPKNPNALTAIDDLLVMRVPSGWVLAKKPKITICHTSDKDNDNVRGEEGERRTIRVSENALDAHLGHGDTVGACPQP